MFPSVAFVFLALLEFTVVNYLWRKECCRNFRQARSYNPAETLAKEMEQESHQRSQHRVSLKVRNIAKILNSLLNTTICALCQ